MQVFCLILRTIICARIFETRTFGQSLWSSCRKTYINLLPIASPNTTRTFLYVLSDRSVLKQIVIEGNGFCAPEISQL